MRGYSFVARVSAARLAVAACGTVDATRAPCGHPGVTVGVSAFSVTTEGCGKKVVTSKAFPVSAPTVLNTGMTLSAQAC